MTNSCTALTHAELSSPPAVKYSVIATPPMSTPCHLGPGDDLQHRCPGDQLAREQHQCPDREQDGGEPADGAAVAIFEEIAEREVTLGRRERPDFRAHPEREHQRAEAGRAVPPPGADAVAIGEARGAHGGAGPDIGGEDGGEDQRPGEAAAGDEEVGRPMTRRPIHMPSAVRPAVYAMTRTRGRFTTGLESTPAPIC